MNYQKVYDSLINIARDRNISGYVERHHVVPKCLGGSNASFNIVKLTAREHYVAHLLLAKIYPLDKGVWYAANMMSNRNSRGYAWVKQRHAENVKEDHTGLRHTVEAKAKMRNAIAKRRASDEVAYCEEQRRRASTPKQKRDGYLRPKTAEHARNISLAAQRRSRLPCSVCGKLITTPNIKNHMKVHTK